MCQHPYIEMPSGITIGYAFKLRMALCEKTGQKRHAEALIHRITDRKS